MNLHEDSKQVSKSVYMWGDRLKRRNGGKTSSLIQDSRCMCHMYEKRKKKVFKSQKKKTHNKEETIEQRSRAQARLLSLV